MICCEKLLPNGFGMMSGCVSIPFTVRGSPAGELKAGAPHGTCGYYPVEFVTSISALCEVKMANVWHVGKFLSYVKHRWPTFTYEGVVWSADNVRVMSSVGGISLRLLRKNRQCVFNVCMFCVECTQSTVYVSFLPPEASSLKSTRICF